MTWSSFEFSKSNCSHHNIFCICSTLPFELTMAKISRSRPTRPSVNPLARSKANEKERFRTKQTNQALDRLKSVLPKMPNQNMVKKEILTTATEYICFLKEVSRLSDSIVFNSNSVFPYSSTVDRKSSKNGKIQPTCSSCCFHDVACRKCRCCQRKPSVYREKRRFLGSMQSGWICWICLWRRSIGTGKVGRIGFCVVGSAPWSFCAFRFNNVNSIYVN